MQEIVGHSVKPCKGSEFMDDSPFTPQSTWALQYPWMCFKRRMRL